MSRMSIFQASSMTIWCGIASICATFGMLQRTERMSGHTGHSMKSYRFCGSVHVIHSLKSLLKNVACRIAPKFLYQMSIRDVCAFRFIQKVCPEMHRISTSYPQVNAWLWTNYVEKSCQEEICKHYCKLLILLNKIYF